MASNQIKHEQDEKRDIFIEKASALFAEKGYRQVGVQEIINHLGISKGGFYWHFSSKLDLYCQSCQMYCVRNRKIFLDILNTNDINAISVNNAAMGLLEWFLDNPFHIRLMIDFHHENNYQPIRDQLQELDNEWIRILSALIQKCQDAGIASSKAPGKTLAKQCSIFFTGLIMHYDIQHDKEVVRTAWQFFLANLFASENMEKTL